MVEVETTPKKELIFFCQKKTLFAFQKPHFKEKKFRIFSSLKLKWVSKYFFLFSRLYQWILDKKTWKTRSSKRFINNSTPSKVLHPSQIKSYSIRIIKHIKLIKMICDHLCLCRITWKTSFWGKCLTAMMLKNPNIFVLKYG